MLEQVGMDRSRFHDPDLLFSAGPHTYTLRGQPLQSVTTFLRRFYEPFDAEYHSARIAARDGGDSQLIADMWERNANEAAECGTEVHAFAEQLALGHDNVDLCSVKVAGYVAACRAWHASHPELHATGGWMIPEVRVCSSVLSLAGTVDLVCRLGGEPALADYKTSRTIHYTGFRQLLPPLENLPDSQFWHYALQINLYSRLLFDRYGYDARRLVVVWLGQRGTFREMAVPLMPRAVDRMLATITLP